MMQVIQEKPNEDPSEFLQRIYQVYHKCSDADPQVPENIQMVNMTFTGQIALDFKRNLQFLDMVLGINFSQLIDIAFKIYHAQETRKLKHDMDSLETKWESQKGMWETMWQGLKEQGKDP